MSLASQYVAGGTVQAGGGIYLSRAADGQLLSLCRQSAFVYILTSRQMGKSSVMVRAAETLIAEGARTVILDLTGFGTDPTAEQWYSSVATAIGAELGILPGVLTWWQEHASEAVAPRLIGLLRDYILAQIHEQVIIFVDEIDTTLSLKFSDDFFAAIRFLYNARATSPQLQRLAIVLIGVASPGDLIKDPQRTPFNVGTRVELTDFSEQEAMPLVRGLPLSEVELALLLRWVLEWTSGHPYLTLRVFRALAESGNWRPDDGVIRDIFFGERGERDSNLEFVRNMLVRETPIRKAVLATYRDICYGQGIKDDSSSSVKSWLKLSGVVAKQNGYLRIRNRIYEAVFTAAWVNRVGEALEAIRKSRTEDIPTPEVERRAAEAKSLGAAGEWPSPGTAVDHETRPNIATMTGLAQVLGASRDNLTAPIVGYLRSRLPLLRPLLLELRHEAGISCVAFSPDTHLLVTGSDDQTVKVWNVNTGELVSQWEHEDRITALDISPNGSLVASASWDGQTQLWKREQNEVLVLAHNDAVPALAFSPDSQSLATACLDANARIWETGLGNMQRVLEHGARVMSVAFSGDSQRIATGSWDRTACLWNTRTGHRIASLPHDGLVNSVAFSADGQRVCSASDDGAVRIWRVRDGRELARLHHQTRVLFAAFSPDGQVVATIAGDGIAHLWDPQTRWRYAQLRQEGRISALGFSHHGERLATAGHDGAARIWHVRSGYELAVLSAKGRLTSVAFNEDDSRIATAGDDGTARVWGAASTPYNATLVHPDRVRRAQFSPDGKWLATACEDGRARVWDMDRQRVVLEREQRGAATAVAFLPQSDGLITCGEVAGVNVWALSTGEKRLSLPESGMTHGVAAARDLILTGGADGTVQLWEIGSGALRTAVTLGAHVWDVAWSPDGERFATACGDGVVNVWNVQGECLLRIEHCKDAYGVRFGADGRTLAVVCADGNLSIWNAQDGSPVARFPFGRSTPGSPQEVEPVSTLASAAERVVFAAATSNRAYIFAFSEEHAQSSIEVVDTEEHISDLALSPAGGVLAICSGAVVNLAPWASEELLRQADRLLQSALPGTVSPQPAAAWAASLQR